MTKFQFPLALLASGMLGLAGCPGTDADDAGATDAGDGDGDGVGDGDGDADGDLDAGGDGDGDGDADGGTTDGGDGDGCLPSTDAAYGSLVAGDRGVPLLSVDVTTTVAWTYWSIATRTTDTTRELIGANAETGAVDVIGPWPGLALPADVLFSPAAGEEGTTYASFVTTNGVEIAAGYSREDYSGAVSLVTWDDQSMPKRIESPGNYSAAFDGDDLVINALGYDALGGAAPGIFVDDADGVSAQAFTFPEEAATSGFTAMGDNVAVFTYGVFGDDGFMNRVLAVSKDSLRAATASEDLEELSSETGTDLGFPDALGIAMAGDTLFVVRGAYDASFNRTFLGVDAVTLNVLDGVVVAGATESVIEVPAGSCDAVEAVHPFGDSVLFEIAHHDGKVVWVEVADL